MEKSAVAEAPAYVRWEEVSGSGDKGRMKVSYFLKREDGSSDLAVVGKEKSRPRHMRYRYTIRDRSLLSILPSPSHLKLRSRTEVIDWLNSIVTGCLNESKRKRKSKGTSLPEDVEYVRGKRFSEREDEILKSTVFSYIEQHALGKDGLHKILHCKTYPEVKDCWKRIAEALPRRPRESIYYRAHILFERSEHRKWTEEDKEYIRNHYREHGAEWKRLAVDLGKHRFHVKDTWRRIRLADKKKGNWSQDEYQNLFDFVNLDLQMKAFEGKKSKHGMLRDNICWGAISERLTTRTDAGCCRKWYGQLTSPMVEEGLWEDVDDYRLLDVLYSLDASCIEDVEWDFLLEHRSGDVCRKRWGQMVNHIGEYGKKSFSEQVEVLSKRYCPELLETREAYDSQPIIP